MTTDVIDVKTCSPQKRSNVSANIANNRLKKQDGSTDKTETKKMKEKTEPKSKLRKKINTTLSSFREIITDDETRKEMTFRVFNVLLAIVAAFMTVVNVFTEKHLLMIMTLVFMIACFLNVFLSHLGEVCTKIANVLFLAEGLALCIAFCITGTPEGFSALWICFIPSFSLTLVGKKWGCAYSAIGLLSILFLFWTPWGKALLQYEYTSSFMLRFPMIYVAFFCLSLFLECVRAETQSKLRDSEKRYQFLYKHDSLTGIYNRYGFNEQLDKVYGDVANKSVTLMILDLDDFKRVNDVYGHSTGDVILRSVARKIAFLGGDNAVVSRWGGEEFTLLCSNIENPETLAENIRRYIAESTITVDNFDINITVSIGVVSSRKNVNIATFVQVADKCLYRAKDAGRNKVDCITLKDEPIKATEPAEN